MASLQGPAAERDRRRGTHPQSSAGAKGHPDLRVCLRRAHRAPRRSARGNARRQGGVMGCWLAGPSSGGVRFLVTRGVWIPASATVALAFPLAAHADAGTGIGNYGPALAGGLLLGV